MLEIQTFLQRFLQTVDVVNNYWLIKKKKVISLVSLDENQ